MNIFEIYNILNTLDKKSNFFQNPKQLLSKKENTDW